MRGTVGAEKKFRIARADRPQQRLTVVFTFEHRQAVVMRADTALEHGIAAIHQMVHRDSRGHAWSRIQNKVDRVCGCDVLEYDLQLGKPRHEWSKHAVYEDFLAVENID